MCSWMPFKQTFMSCSLSQAQRPFYVTCVCAWVAGCSWKRPDTFMNTGPNKNWAEKESLMLLKLLKGTWENQVCQKAQLHDKGLVAAWDPSFVNMSFHAIFKRRRFDLLIKFLHRANALMTSLGALSEPAGAERQPAPIFALSARDLCLIHDVGADVHKILLLHEAHLWPWGLPLSKATCHWASLWLSSNGNCSKRRVLWRSHRVVIALNIFDKIFFLHLHPCCVSWVENVKDPQHKTSKD